MGSKIVDETLCPPTMVRVKKSALKTWSRFPFLTPVFAALSCPVPEVASGMMAVIEWYVVI